jgi:hypothetical protein
MALNTAKLQSDLISLFKEMRGKTENADKEFAQKFSNIMKEFVESGTVTVNAGIPVQTAPTTGTGVTSGPGTGTIK